MDTNISFFVNGKKYEVPLDLERDTPLITFLRDHVGLKGTKYMCQEGACGACVVNYTTRHPVTQIETSVAVNSCLVSTLSCHGASITTIEGIGNKVMGYHKIQAALAKFNGTQCGFCSPGMVMNMYSLLSLDSELRMNDVEESFAGNICRCTGYRPILDAFKSLSSDATENLKEKLNDIEDLWKLCNRETPLWNCEGCPFIDYSEPKLSLKRINYEYSWYIPQSIEDITELLKEHENYRLVAGNTGQGVYRSNVLPEVYINISHVPQLKNFTYSSEQLELGANMTLTETINLFNTLSKEANFEYLNVLADHIKLIANVPVRNIGTLAGNLMIKYYHPEFPSDLFLLLETIGAEIVRVTEAGEERSMSPKEMIYNKDMNKSVITKIILPALSEEYTVRTFKIMPRAQNAYALVNAGFLFQFDEDYFITKRPNIVYGGINSVLVHAEQTEDYFNGKNIFDAFNMGVSMLSEEIVPSESVLVSSTYKKRLALNLFYKYVLGLKPNKVDSFYQSGGNNLERPLSQGIQEYETKTENWPLTKPVNKLEAIFQCSGEADYINDIPELRGQLFGALVLAEQADATIESIDPSPALALKGVVAFYSAEDIPGKNIFTRKGFLIWEEEELFCSGKTLYGGQPVGIVIAETEGLANKASQMVKINYVELPVEQLCLSVKDILKNGDEMRIKHFATFEPERDINDDKEIFEVQGEFELGPQYHFTMEPQSCVCSPTEEGIKIYSSTQWMACIQGAVSEVLNIPENSIDMEVKRIGGGFGSKITRASMVATACALAAFKLNCPVKVVLDIQTNMKAVGKRNATYSKYEANKHIYYYHNHTLWWIPSLLAAYVMSSASTFDVIAPSHVAFDIGFEDGAIASKALAEDIAYAASNDGIHRKAGFDETGYIEWLKVWLYSDEGCSRNDPSVIVVKPGICNCYDSSGWEINIYSVLTSTPASSWMRAPGTLEGMTLIEEVIEHISYALKKDPLEVRMRNIGEKFSFIENIITTLKDSSSYFERKEEIESFNKLNRWKKKGISLVPMAFGLDYFFNLGAMVSIYAGDGTVSITHGGVEMGQGINTKAAQICASTLGIDLSKIRVKSSSVLTSPNSHMSGASISSDNIVYSTMKACEILNERLEATKNKMNEATWEEITLAAYLSGINLNASYLPQQRVELKKYIIYGAAVTEVEVDVLTGQYHILRVDILEDAGESISPEIDIGQVEGGFVMGLGYFLMENIAYDSSTGLTLTNNSSNYWVPGAKDIPIDFRVTLLKNAPNPLGVARSKATGEPPVCLAISAVHALRNAILSAREDSGLTEWIPLCQPFSVQKVCQAAEIMPEHFNF